MPPARAPAASGAPPVVRRMRSVLAPEGFLGLGGGEILQGGVMHPRTLHRWTFYQSQRRQVIAADAIFNAEAEDASLGDSRTDRELTQATPSRRCRMSRTTLMNSASRDPTSRNIASLTAPLVVRGPGVNRSLSFRRVIDRSGLL